MIKHFNPKFCLIGPPMALESAPIGPEVIQVYFQVVRVLWLVVPAGPQAVVWPPLEVLFMAENHSRA